VSAVPVGSVEVSPSETVLEVDATTQLGATAKAADGSTLAGRPATWRSSDASVARVNARGVVTGIGQGSAKIVATIEGKSDTADVTVTPRSQKPVASVDIEQEVGVVEVGKTFQFTAVVKAADGSVLSGRAITWAVGTPTVARIGATGLATGLAEGSTLITATCDGYTGNATLSVTPAAGVVRTWRGGASAKPTDWSTGSNWSPAGAPSARDTARIAPADEPAVLGENEQIAKLIIAGGRLHTAGHRLTIRKP
jgi:uncharacterized protein YjdB